MGMAASSRMTLSETIQARQSIREFQDRAVEEDKLQTILSAANQAPSAGNCQAFQIFLVRDGSLKAALAEAALGQEFVARAPVVLVFCAALDRAAKYGERGRSLYALQDTTIAAAYVQLAATAEGLATCWVGAFDEEVVARGLQLIPGLRPIVLLPVGYGGSTPPRTPRRPLAEMVQEFRSPT
jgi:nitroreductase